MTLPAIDALDTYGGAKQNDRPVEDPTTDEDAEDINKMKVSVAGATQTATRAIRRFVGHATTPAEPSSNPHFSVWGNDPSDSPNVTKGGTGIYDITYPTTVTDELGEVHSLVFVCGTANVSGATAYHAQVETTASPNVMRVRVFDMAGAANDAVGATISVFLR